VGVTGTGRQCLALAGNGKQLLRFFNGINHGIVALNIITVLQYHVLRVEPFMVLVIEQMPGRIGWLPLSPSVPRIR